MPPRTVLSWLVVTATCSQPGEKACSELFSYDDMDETLNLLQDMQTFAMGVPSLLCGPDRGPAGQCLCQSSLCHVCLVPCPDRALLQSLHFRSCQESNSSDSVFLLHMNLAWGCAPFACLLSHGFICLLSTRARIVMNGF